MESVLSVPLRLLVLLLLCVSRCLSVQITRLSIPSFVPNGSEESVLLDCEYTYNLEEDTKVVVKWFHEDDPNHVYQWIPELNLKSFSEKFNLDENYRVPTGNSRIKSGAITLQKPTTELSGTYRCEVQSLQSSDKKEDIMVVYAQPTFVNLNYTREDGLVRLVCDVENVFPLPEMSLFQIKPKSVDTLPFNDTDLEFELEDGAYDVEFFTTIPEEDLPRQSDGPTFFGCSIDLKGTNYSETLRIPYIPYPVAEKQEGNDSDDNSSTIEEVAPLVVFLSVLLLLLT